MSRPYTYPFGVPENPYPKYKKDYRVFNEKTYLRTRYTTEDVCWSTRWRDGSEVTGPRGGRAMRQYAKGVWYSESDGKFYTIKRRNTGQKDCFWDEMVPVTGRLYDVCFTTTRAQGLPVAEIGCKDGEPLWVSLDGGEDRFEHEHYDLDGSSWPMVEELLFLRRDQRLPRAHYDRVA